jgi:hypothetical protein
MKNGKMEIFAMPALRTLSGCGIKETGTFSE